MLKNVAFFFYALHTHTAVISVDRKMVIERELDTAPSKPRRYSNEYKNKAIELHARKKTETKSWVFVENVGHAFAIGFRHCCGGDRFL